jgi:hypothetical protein
MVGTGGQPTWDGAIWEGACGKGYGHGLTGMGAHCMCAIGWRQDEPRQRCGAGRARAHIVFGIDVGALLHEALGRSCLVMASNVQWSETLRTRGGQPIGGSEAGCGETIACVCGWVSGLGYRCEQMRLCGVGGDGAAP